MWRFICRNSWVVKRRIAPGTLPSQRIATDVILRNRANSQVRIVQIRHISVCDTTA